MQHRTRVGLELELCAPSGRTRFDFARAMARAVKGRLEHRLHYHGEGFLPSGRHDCVLSPAARVLDAKGRWLLDVVDDITVSVPRGAKRGWRAKTDDVRLALLAEKHCASPRAELRDVLEPLRRRLDAQWHEDRLVDSVGHPFVVLEAADVARARVCEVVTRPLSHQERNGVVALVLKTAQRLRFQIPREAAMHAHFDAEGLRNTASLRALILDFQAQRDTLWKMLQPNPRCTKLGPFAEPLLEVARQSEKDLRFSAFAAALSIAGATKYCDLNILGAIERFPRHPTVELRCLPVDFSLEATLDRLDLAEAFVMAHARLDR